MTRTRRTVGIALSAVLLAAALAVGVKASQGNTAGGPPPFRGRFMLGPRRADGPFAPLRMLASRLNLTDTQKTEMKKIVQAHREEWGSLAGRAADARQALHDAVAADVIDDAAIRQRSAALAVVEADVAVARAHARAELFSVLTPEQQAQAKALRAEMIGR